MKIEEKANKVILEFESLEEKIIFLNRMRKFYEKVELKEVKRK